VFARSGEVRRIRIAGFEGWVAGGKFTIGGDALYVFSIHTPGRGRGIRRLSYVKESRRIVDAILARVPRFATLIVGGDFNFSLGERVAGDPRPIRPSELAALTAFRAQGFTIAWRDRYREKPLAQTLRWMRAPTTPYHCDGFLVRGGAVSVISCEVLDDRALHAHSDHNPVLLDLQHQERELARHR
jgi:endonuclease/exonuclease/phosphatase family metal-dependent hydrolase